MNEKAFFDTNVLVYTFDNKSLGKQQIARQLMADYGSHGNLVISTQVLQEFYVTVTKTGKMNLELADAEAIVHDLAEFPLVQVDTLIISRAMQRHQSGVFSFWDSLIVEAALQAGCTILFSEDMQHGLQIDTLQIRNPFA